MNDEQNKPSPSSSEKRKPLLIKGGSSLLVALMTAVIGFYVYDFLGRENVEIANIEVKQLSFASMTLVREAYHSWNYGLSVPSLSVRGLSTDEDFSPPDYGLSVHSGWFQFNLGRDIKDQIGDSNIYVSEIDNQYKNLDNSQIKLYLEEISKELKIQDEKLAELNTDYAKLSAIGRLAENEKVKQANEYVIKYSNEEIEIEIKTEFQNPSETEEYLKKLTKAVLEEINKRMDNYREHKKKHEKLLKDIVGNVYQKIIENQNKYQVEVVVFNSGEKQAVVRYKGKIDIDGIIVNLRRKKDSSEIHSEMQAFVSAISGSLQKEEFLNDFVIIESKSFNGMTLVIDEYNNRKRDMEFSQREYMAGQKLATLVIYDINDNKSHQKQFNFRNALYEGERENLKDFLEKEYKIYVAR